MPLFTDYTTQYAIDKEIAAHRAAIHDLSFRRNQLSAVNKLPIDVLATIFLAYKESFHPFEGKDDRFAASNSNIDGGWTNVLRICTHWRSIILNTPDFWTSLELSPDVIVADPDLPSRSKALPLYVYFAMFKPKDDQNVGTITFNPEVWTLRNYNKVTCSPKMWKTAEGLVSQNLARFQRLFLDFEVSAQDEVEELLAVMTKYSAPSLQSLKIRCQPLMEDGEVTYPQIISHSPLKITPSLRVLELVEILVPLTFPQQLPSLTTLSVKGSDRLDGISIDWIIAFLWHTSNIEVIKVNGIVPKRPTGPSSTRVPLPLLRILNVTGVHVTTALLFDLIDFPLAGSTQITYSTSDFDDRRPDSITALKTLCANFTSAHSPSATFKLRMVPIYSQFILLPLHGNDPHSLASLTLHLRFLDTPTFFDIYSNAPLAQVVDLTITNNIPLHQIPQWQATLLACSGIQSLEFCECNISFIPHLRSTGNPLLNTLYLTEVNWNRAYNYQNLADVRMELTRALAKFFDERRGAGYEIRKLIIRRCNITPEYVDLLKMHVEVDWDGVDADWVMYH
ncbi:hypothetical protein ONZ45_g11360 [Pleurotus djamor]|nr:hypothetical protein ONZ45_g11360 [Pleurotus djamor]